MLVRAVARHGGPGHSSPRCSGAQNRQPNFERRFSSSDPSQAKREKKEANPSIFQNKKEHKNQTRVAININKIPIEIEGSPTPRDKEAIMRDQLERENAWLRGHLQERENQLECMASLSLEPIQCRMQAKSHALYLRKQWLQFQIKTLAQRGTMPF